MTISVKKSLGQRFRRIPEGKVAYFWTNEDNIPVLYDVLSNGHGQGGVVFRRPHLRIPREGKKGYELIAQAEHTQTFHVVAPRTEQEYPFGRVKGS